MDHQEARLTVRDQGPGFDLSALPDPRDPETYRDGWEEVRDIATRAGRYASAITGAMYLTLKIDNDAAAAQARMAAFFDAYYPGRGEQIARTRPWYAGGASGAASSSFFIRFMPLMTMKMAKATITKSSTV